MEALTDFQRRNGHLFQGGRGRREGRLGPQRVGGPAVDQRVDHHQQHHQQQRLEQAQAQRQTGERPVGQQVVKVRAHRRQNLAPEKKKTKVLFGCVFFFPE